jgi:hypothetical protein
MQVYLTSCYSLVLLCPGIVRMSISLDVVDRRGKDRGSYTLNPSDTVGTLKKQFAQKSTLCFD